MNKFGKLIFQEKIYLWVSLLIFKLGVQTLGRMIHPFELRIVNCALPIKNQETMPNSQCEMRNRIL
jgi:hypothetical protein